MIGAMRKAAGGLLTGGLLAVSAVPAFASNYVVTTDFSSPVVLPAIDQARERIALLGFTVGGTVRYDIRQYGQGLDVGSYQDTDRVAYIGGTTLGGKIVDAYGLADGVSAANTMGAPGTYIDYGYDVMLDENARYIVAGDVDASLFDLFYAGPQTVDVELRAYPEAPLRGRFSNLRIFGRFDIATTSVPEPASWAMMLAGFGIMGAGLRYCRRKIAVS